MKEANEKQNGKIEEEIEVQCRAKCSQWQAVLMDVRNSIVATDNFYCCLTKNIKRGR